MISSFGWCSYSPTLYSYGIPLPKIFAMTPERLVSESINSPHWKNWHLKRSKLGSRDCFSFFLLSGGTSGETDANMDQLCRPNTLSRTLGVQLEILALTQVAIKFTTEGAGRCAWLATSTNLFLGQPSTIVWRYLTSICIKSVYYGKYTY